MSEVKKELVFGRSALSMPTPMFAKYILRAFAFLSGVWAIVSPALTNLDPLTLGEINKWLVIGNTVLLFAIKFFGWDYNPTEN